jgi:hypothetical protein
LEDPEEDQQVAMSQVMAMLMVIEKEKENMAEVEHGKMVTVRVCPHSPTEERVRCLAPPTPSPARAVRWAKARHWI